MLTRSGYLKQKYHPFVLMGGILRNVIANILFFCPYSGLFCSFLLYTVLLVLPDRRGLRDPLALRDPGLPDPLAILGRLGPRGLPALMGLRDPLDLPGLRDRLGPLALPDPLALRPQENCFLAFSVLQEPLM